MAENKDPAIDQVTMLNAQATFKEFQAVASDHLMVRSAATITQSPSKIKFDGTSEAGGNTATTTYIKMRVGSCREAYENSGIIGNAIDLMVDFALEGFQITHEDRSIQRFYNAWAKKVRLSQIAGQILKSYFRDGNVPILRFRDRIKLGEFKKLRLAVAQTLFNTEDVTTRDRKSVV